MKVIWKYELDLIKLDSDNALQLTLPVGARILHGTTTQDLRRLLIWCEFSCTLNFNYASEPRTLYVFGTGHIIPDHLTHILTMEVRGDPFVWHLYEAPRD